jgi:CRP-like cAMP-binding protein
VTAIGELLERVPFVAALGASDREALAAAAKRRRFKRDEAIFDKDDPGESLFIIDKGSVRIYLPSPQGADLTLAMLGSGDFFGDMALLDGRPRSASAAALRETETVALDRADFTAVIRSRPEAAMAVLAAVAQRLRETNEMAGDLAFLCEPQPGAAPAGGRHQRAGAAFRDTGRGGAAKVRRVGRWGPLGIRGPLVPGGREWRRPRRPPASPG